MPEPGSPRRLVSTRTIDLRSTLSVLRRGAGDPTWLDLGANAPVGGMVKAWRTPAGPVVVRLGQEGPHEVAAQAWGPGAHWLLDRLPTLLGEGDDDAGFVAHHAPIKEARRRHPGWRVARTGLVVESLVPSILEQKVTGREAFGAYRRLVRRFGEPAPGPYAVRGLMLAPTPAQWAAVPSWEWLKAGVDPVRSRTIVTAVRHAGRLEEAADDPDLARRRLAALPGVGGWTVAEVAHTALGDADAVSFGDYHVARHVGYALLGRELDDAGLAVLLEPYAGHRYRVQALVSLALPAPPRRGPRRSLPTHFPR